jgi:hypothetical protein
MPTLGIGFGGSLGGLPGDTGSVRIDGRTYSWASVWCTIAGIDFRYPTELEMDEALTQEYGYGLGQDFAPVELTPGKYEPKPFKMTFRAVGESVLNAILSNAAAEQGYHPAAIGKGKVTIQYGYYEPNLAPVTIQVISANLASRPQALKNDAGILVLPWTFAPMRYIRNGTTLWDCSETGPV